MPTSPEGDLSLPYQTLRDPFLQHQVIFTRTNNSIYVSCNCRAEFHGPGLTISYSPIGEADGDLDESRNLYNNPDNHWKPFSAKDRAKW